MIRALLVASTLLASAALAQGRIVIINANQPGVGFNDPTPAAPVGGNPGTTLGEQRLNVFNRAAEIWTETVKPKTDVLVQAQFISLAPGVLGSAGTTFIFSDFPGAEYPNTWYHSALADQLAGEDLNPGFADIGVNFSTNFPFYFGYDSNEPAGTFDLLAVALHEIGHGMGFSNFVNEATGAAFLGLLDIYSQYTTDVTQGKRWVELTDAERAASAINVGNVTWDGVHVNDVSDEVLQVGEPSVVFSSPASLGGFTVGAAAFGPPLASPGVTGPVALGIDPSDAAGPSTTDACSPLTGSYAGQIVLVDRGTCGFTVKVKNAQNAGALAVLVADNVLADPPPGLGGADPTITIPSARVSLTAGNAIKAALAGGSVTGTLGLDQSRRAGTDRVRGLVRLAALNPVALGSSISHYDSTASRNLLMEPAINADLTSSLRPPEDLTAPLMTDIGWFSDADGIPDGRDACIGSAQTETVEIGECVTTAPNTVFVDGCRTSDLVDACDDRTRGRIGFILCVTKLSFDLRKEGIITGHQQASLLRCAVKSGVGKRW